MAIVTQDETLFTGVSSLVDTYIHIAQQSENMHIIALYTYIYLFTLQLYLSYNTFSYYK